MVRVRVKASPIPNPKRNPNPDPDPDPDPNQETSVVTDPQIVQIFWNGLMTEVMMTAFLMSAEPDDGAPSGLGI